MAPGSATPPRSKAIPRDQQGPRDCPRIPRAVRGPDCRPPVNFRAWLALHRGRPAISKRWSQRFGEPLLPPPRPERSDHADPPDRAHDRGRCPLYVRAQLDTVGLSWTQRALVRLKATASEPGKTQLTGYFRRWWQVLGSNQRRLSRRFYRPLPLATRATCLARPAGTGIQKNSGTGALGQHADPG